MSFVMGKDKSFKVGNQMNVRASIFPESFDTEIIIKTLFVWNMKRQMILKYHITIYYILNFIIGGLIKPLLQDGVFEIYYYILKQTGNISPFVNRYLSTISVEIVLE